MSDLVPVLFFVVLCATYGLLIWAGTLGNR
jgi:hypothetical protein